ncbi:MAG: hypothetical protein WDW38_001042 [Sanguina aurantia]
MEQDLAVISSVLGVSLGKVTQLNIELFGTEPEGDFTACEPSTYPPLGMQAACTVHALAPHCSPLLQVAVSGKVEAPTDFCILPLLAAAQNSCSSSLTHITVNLPRVIDLINPGDHQSEALLPSFPSLNDTSCSALRSFTRMTHLHLDGFIESAAVWPALPATLTSLQLDFILFGPQPGVILPSLQRLALNQCGCSELALLLRASPLLHQLTLREICSPSTTQAAADLCAIYDHPLLRLDNVEATPPTIEFGHSYNAGTSDLEVQLGLEIPPWKILPLLPCMPAILRCNFDSVHSDQGEGPPLDWDQQPGAYLHHIPRIFPSITHLDLSCAIRPDSDFESLHACTKLTSLKLSRCDQLSDAGLIALATSLTGLVSLSIELCRCVSVDVFGKISAETPGHTTEPQAGYEIRTYSPQIRAEFSFQTASAEDGISSGLNTPFRALAGYIFGGNEKGGGSESITMTSPVVVQKSGSGSGGGSPSGKGGSEKIAMTVPVVMQREGEGACKERKMSFILPSKYTGLDQLPTPKNPDVHFKVVPSHKMAAIRFRGSMTAPLATSKEAELREAAARDGTPLSTDPTQVQFCSYNPLVATQVVGCIPSQRTNDILIPVEVPAS